jgi:hypothetical protein
VYFRLNLFDVIYNLYKQNCNATGRTYVRCGYFMFWSLTILIIKPGVQFCSHFSPSNPRSSSSDHRLRADLSRGRPPSSALGSGRAPTVEMQGWVEGYLPCGMGWFGPAALAPAIGMQRVAEAAQSGSGCCCRAGWGGSGRRRPSRCIVGLLRASGQSVA